MWKCDTTQRVYSLCSFVSTTLSCGAFVHSLYFCTLGNVSYSVFTSSFVLLTQSKYAVNRPLVSLSPEAASSVSVGTLRSHPLVDPRVNAWQRTTQPAPKCQSPARSAQLIIAIRLMQMSWERVTRLSLKCQWLLFFFFSSPAAGGSEPASWDWQRGQAIDWPFSNREKRRHCWWFVKLLWWSVCYSDESWCL